MSARERSVALCLQGACKVFEVEELAGQGGHKGGGNPLVGSMTESDPQRHALPLHSSA